MDREGVIRILRTLIIRQKRWSRHRPSLETFGTGEVMILVFEGLGDKWCSVSVIIQIWRCMLKVSSATQGCGDQIPNTGTITSLLLKRLPVVFSCYSLMNILFKRKKEGNWNVRWLVNGYLPLVDCTFFLALYFSSRPGKSMLWQLCNYIVIITVIFHNLFSFLVCSLWIIMTADKLERK